MAAMPMSRTQSSGSLSCRTMLLNSGAQTPVALYAWRAQHAVIRRSRAVVCVRRAVLCVRRGCRRSEFLLREKKPVKELDAKEAAFQQDIIDQMCAGGWTLGDPSKWVHRPQKAYGL